MKFKELNELFNTKDDIELKKINSNTYMYTYELSDIINYRFSFYETATDVKIKNKRVSDIWEYIFLKYNKLTRFSSKELEQDNKVQFKIFSIAIQTLKEFIKLKNPNGILFSAKEESRRNLYDKLSQKLNNENYTLVNTSIIKNDKYYIFIRNDLLK